MIVTVTPNPSLDRTIQVDQLTPGGVHRAEAVLLDPGGKGVNVARALAAADVSTQAILPFGGPEGQRLAELLTPESVPVIEVPLRTRTRSNITVVDGHGTTSKFNEPGPLLDESEVRALENIAGECADTANWVVSCGSLPDGCPADLHARVVRAAHRAGSRAAVDASGDALRSAIDAGPDLIKPNLTELAELAGRDLDDLGEVIAVARQLRTRGVGAVLVSLGELGAVLLDESGAWHASSPATEVRSTVGAGDAMLAGYLRAATVEPARHAPEQRDARNRAGQHGAQLEDHQAEALRSAVAYGTAAVGLHGSHMPTPADVFVDRVRVDIADETASLSGVAA